MSVNTTKTQTINKILEYSELLSNCYEAVSNDESTYNTDIGYYFSIAANDLRAHASYLKEKVYVGGF